MQRTARLLLILPLVFVLDACQDAEIVSPPSPPLINADIIDAGHNAVNPHAWWLAPQWLYSSFTGTAVTDLSPLVEICKWNGSSCPSGVVATFKRSNGTIVIGSANDYNAAWNWSALNPKIGDVYRVTVYLNEFDAQNTLLLARDLIFVKNKKEAEKIGVNNVDYAPVILSPSAPYPIRFRLEQGVTTASLDLGFSCPSSIPEDCFEKTYTFEENGTINTTEDGELDEAAFKVDWSNVKINGEPAGEGDSFTLVIAEKALVNGKCELAYGGPQKGACVVFETVPENVTFENSAGPQGLAQVCPEGDNTGYDLAKADEGTITFPPRGDNIFNCPTTLSRMPGLIRGLARLLLPRALYADDEGETGTVGGFSTLFWAMPVNIEGNSLPTGPFLPFQDVTLSFRVVRAHGSTAGNGQDGVTVNLSAAAGVLSAPSDVTADGGVADVIWTAPSVPGTYAIIAAVPGTEASLTFTAIVEGDVNVLLISGGHTNTLAGLEAALQAEMPDATIETFWANDATPTASYLSGFNTVVLYEDGTFSNAQNVGNAVADYVAAGGNLIIGTFYWQNRSNSGFGTPGWGGLESIDPLVCPASGSCGSEYAADQLNVSSIVVHPLTTGIASLSVGSETGFHGGVAARADATVVASWSDGVPLAGYRRGASGQRLVGLSVAPGYLSGAASYASSGVPDFTGNLAQLWENAIRWTAAGSVPTAPTVTSLSRSALRGSTAVTPGTTTSMGGSQGRRK